MADVQIGQTLYDPPRRRGQDYTEYKVESIGRKWIALSGGARCTIDGLLLDCHPYSPAQLYSDKATYEQEVRLKAAWSDLRRDLSNKHQRPEGITVETINAARRLLGLEVLEVQDAA